MGCFFPISHVSSHFVYFLPHFLFLSVFIIIFYIVGWKIWILMFFLHIFLERSVSVFFQFLVKLFCHNFVLCYPVIFSLGLNMCNNNYFLLIQRQMCYFIVRVKIHDKSYWKIVSYMCHIIIRIIGIL